jgi:hypothetical protein
MRKPKNPVIKCKDGFTMSVQADGSAYCEPREDYPDVSYTQVECGYPSADPETVAFREYAEMCGTEDYCETVYSYVPVAIVQAEFDAHGGIVEGRMPSNVEKFDFADWE